MPTLHILLTRRSDGLQRLLSWPEWAEWDGNDYWWSEGNAGCDCNRAQWFAEAGNEVGEDHPPCGSDLFGVRLTQGDDPTVLYED